MEWKTNEERTELEQKGELKGMVDFQTKKTSTCHKEKNSNTKLDYKLG